MLFEALTRISNTYHRIKTAFWYSLFFKKLGRKSLIRRPIFIRHPQFIEIGKGVLIRDNARLEVVYHKDGPVPLLHIGDNTNIEQNVHIVCRQRVYIGANVSITANSCVVDVDHPYQDVTDPRKVGGRISSGESYVEIGDGSFIGFGCVIMPNVRIGKGCVIGANSVVNSDLPDYTVAVGTPAKPIKQFDFSSQKWIKISHLERIQG